MMNPGPAIASTANTSGLMGGGGQASIYVAGGNDGNIQQAINAMAAAGGGIVQLGPGTFQIFNPITPAAGVRIIGTPAQINLSAATAPDGNNVVANGGGTILTPGGSYAGSCFQWSKAVLGSGQTPNQFDQTGLIRPGLSDLCFFGNFSRAIDAGNTNNAAAWNANFSDLYISGCSDTGFWITNFQHCKFERIYTYACVQGAQWYGNDVANSLLTPGNSTWHDLYAVSPSNNANAARMITHIVSQGQQNEGTIVRVQSNNQNKTTVTQAATMTASSANIGVTDSTKFLVGQPVVFSAAVNGFAANVIYFVLSSAANVITVGTTYGAASLVTATGNTAVNVTNQGWPCLEFIAVAGASLTAYTVLNIDVESGGTAAIVCQNMSSSYFQINQVPSQNWTQSLCGRSLTYSDIFATTPVNTDLDAASVNTFLWGKRGTGSVQRYAPGMYWDQAAGQTFCNFALGANSIQGLQGSTAGDGTFLVVPTGAGIGTHVTQITAASFSLQCQHSGDVLNAYTGGAQATTLPSLAAATINGQATYKIVNPQSSNMTITVANTGSETFNGVSGRTVLTLGAGAGCVITGVRDTNAKPYWSVTGIAGSYSAGTITGL